MQNTGAQCFGGKVNSQRRVHGVLQILQHTEACCIRTKWSIGSCNNYVGSLCFTVPLPPMPLLSTSCQTCFCNSPWAIWQSTEPGVGPYSSLVCSAAAVVGSLGVCCHVKQERERAVAIHSMPFWLCLLPFDKQAQTSFILVD